MAIEEGLTLDGLDINDSVTFGLLTLDMPVPRQRQEWIGAADSEVQRLANVPLHENRRITARVAVLPQASMDDAHDEMALLIDKLQAASQDPGGIELEWTPATGTRTVTFNVLAGEIVDLPIDWENGWLSNSPEFTIEMVAEPYWLGEEVTTGTTAGSAVFVAMEVANVPGDVPSTGRLIITDTASQSRRHVEWGLEGPRTYNASTSLLIDSDNLVTSGFAGSQTTQGGSYDPNSSGNNVVSATLTTTPTAVCGTGNLSHVGTFRVKARILSNVGCAARLSWRAGDAQFTSNAWVPVTIEADWQELDLGTITIPVALAGSQRWTGQIEATGIAVGFGTLVVDYLVLVPTSCGYGKARAVYSYVPGVVTGYDPFTSTTATSALNGRTAPAGGSWATSGSTTDFAFADDLSGEQVKRSTNSDSGRRFAILGSSTPTDTDVAVDVRHSTAPSSSSPVELGVIARWVDSSNYLAVYRKLDRSSGSTVRSLVIEQVVAASATTLASIVIPDGLPTSAVWHTIRAVVYASGRVIASNTTSGAVIAETEATSSALASGGALDDGKPGFFDRVAGADVITRHYDNFAIGTPAAEPIVIYSGRQLQVRHDNTIRQDSSGTYTGRPASYRGSRFLVPVGTSRVLVKARRSDIETMPDTNVTDSLQIQVAYTPRGLAVPR